MYLQDFLFASGVFDFEFCNRKVSKFDHKRGSNRVGVCFCVCHCVGGSGFSHHQCFLTGRKHVPSSSLWQNNLSSLSQLLFCLARSCKVCVFLDTVFVRWTSHPLFAGYGATKPFKSSSFLLRLCGPPKLRLVSWHRWSTPTGRLCLCIRSYYFTWPLGGWFWCSSHATHDSIIYIKADRWLKAVADCDECWWGSHAWHGLWLQQLTWAGVINGLWPDGAAEWGGGHSKKCVS